MVVAVTVVPLIALNHAGGVSGVGAAMAEAEISASLIPPGSAPILAIISTAAWGLGYFGQPHILARFMGARSVGDISKSTVIAVVWVVFSLTFAVAVGLIGIPLFPELSGPASETVFIQMVRLVFHPWIAGVLLAAVLSAIMSTIDSQLLVSSSSLTEDFYAKVLRRDTSPRELFFVGRISVIVIALIAMGLAMNPEATILGLVSYAWGGFGAAFGPVILMALFSRRTTWKSALAGMLTGTVVLIVWDAVGLGAVMYEIVPGFIANFAAIFLGNAITQQQDTEILAGFDEQVSAVKAEL